MKDVNLGEKVSVNINTATLSSIDLLVDNGYFSNRSDFINHALREAVASRQATIDRIAEENAQKQGDGLWFVGVNVITGSYIRKMLPAIEKKTITGYGMLIIDDSCSEQELFAAISEINVKGIVVCSETVREHYGLKGKKGSR